MRLLNASHSTMIRGGKSARQFVRIGGNMNTKTCAVTVIFLLAAAAVCFASTDAQLGIWKLNEAKSKMAAGIPKNHTVVYEAAGDSIKVTIDGTDSDGKPTHNEWTGKIDGKDYPVTGDSSADTRSYRAVNDHALAFAGEKNGKVQMSDKLKVCADGNTRTSEHTAKHRQ